MAGHYDPLIADIAIFFDKPEDPVEVAEFLERVACWLGCKRYRIVPAMRPLDPDLRYPDLQDALVLPFHGALYADSTADEIQEYAAGIIHFGSRVRVKRTSLGYARVAFKFLQECFPAPVFQNYQEGEKA